MKHTMTNAQHKEFAYGIREIPYQVVRKKRRSVKIEVNPVAEVLVTAPEAMPEQTLEKEVKRSGGVIYRRIIAAENSLEKLKPLMNEEAILFQGELVPLIRKEDQRRRRSWLTYEDGAFQTNATGEKLRKLIVQFYKSKALEPVQSKVAHFAEKMGVGPVESKIKAQRKRWGSWAKSGVIYMNYLCVAFGPEVLDYIIVHELAHVKHKAHSKGFWAEVAGHCPDAKKIDKLLSTDGALIVHLYN